MGNKTSQEAEKNESVYQFQYDIEDGAVSSVRGPLYTIEKEGKCLYTLENAYKLALLQHKQTGGAEICIYKHCFQNEENKIGAMELTTKEHARELAEYLTTKKEALRQFLGVPVSKIEHGYIARVSRSLSRIVNRGKLLILRVNVSNLLFPHWGNRFTATYDNMCARLRSFEWNPQTPESILVLKPSATLVGRHVTPQLILLRPKTTISTTKISIKKARCTIVGEGFRAKVRRRIRGAQERTSPGVLIMHAAIVGASIYLRSATLNRYLYTRRMARENLNRLKQACVTASPDAEEIVPYVMWMSALFASADTFFERSTGNLKAAEKICADAELIPRAGALDGVDLGVQIAGGIGLLIDPSWLGLGMTEAINLIGIGRMKETKRRLSFVRVYMDEKSREGKDPEGLADVPDEYVAEWDTGATPAAMRKYLINNSTTPVPALVFIRPDGSIRNSSDEIARAASIYAATLFD